MFRFNIENNEVELKATLYKNKREKLGIIHNEWIKKISRQLEEIDYLEISIPKYIGVEKKINPIYFKVNPMQQITLEETNKLGEVIKSRFVLTEPNNNMSKYSGVKTFKAMSFEHKLSKKRTQFEGKVMQLISDETHIGEGVLDKFVNECKDWTVGYVDPKSRVDTRLGVEVVNVNLFDNFVDDKVEENSIIWEKDVTTTIEEDMPLYLSIEYKALSTYDANGKVLVTSNIINQVTEPLYGNIKKIIARHYSEVGNRFAIEYEFILTDNVSTKRVLTFTNVIDKKITCENIKLVWETGKIIENSNIKYINIESIDDNWLNVLQDLAQQFTSVVLFDSYNKEVSVIHRDNLGKNSGYLLSYDNSVVDVDITESSTYPNVLKVIGKDGLSIQSENIYGGDYLYDYSYYIDNNVMSKELEVAWKRYEEYLAMRQEEYLVIKNERMTIQQRKTKIDSEIKSLNERIKNLNNLLSAYIAQGGSSDQERLKAEIDELKTRLEECLLDRNNYQTMITELDDEIIKLSSEISQENATDSNGKIFADLDLEELREFEVMESYTDEYYSTPYALISHSKNVLADMTKPEIEFNVNCDNLAKIIRNPKGWNKVLTLGDLFNIEDGLIEGYKEDSVRLVGYEYTPETKTVSNVTFGNKFKKIDINRSLSNIGKKTNDSANVLGTFKEIFDDVKMSTDWVQGVIDGGLDLNAQYIRGKGMRNYIQIDESGITLTDQTDENKQIYIGSSCIGLTNDGFAHSELCITTDGVIAHMLIGEIILGKELYITSELGEFYIGNMDENDGFGLAVYDENKTKRVFLGSEMINGVRKAVLRLIGKDGELALSEDGIVSEFQFCDRSAVDSTAPMRSYFRIQDNVNILKECILTVKLLPFRVHSKGMEGGGGYVQGVSTLSGGGSTSGGGGSYSEAIGTTSEYSSVSSQGLNYIGWTGNDMPNVDGVGHYHSCYSSELHKHDLSIPISIPSHIHSTPDHNHITNLNIPSHTHPEKYGCFDLGGNDNIPSDVSLKVNGQTIRQNINGDFEINITSYLVKGKMNNIELSSATRGQIYFNLYCKSFVLW